jgi:hypothetical protein
MPTQRKHTADRYIRSQAIGVIHTTIRLSVQKAVSHHVQPSSARGGSVLVPVRRIRVVLYAYVSFALGAMGLFGKGDGGMRAIVWERSEMQVRLWVSALQ